MHDWICQIVLIELIWQKKLELKESSIVGNGSRYDTSVKFVFHFVRNH